MCHCLHQLIICVQANISSVLPLLVLGILGIVGGVLALFLPETLDKDLPQTLQDGENFGKGQRFLDFPCCSKLVSFCLHLNLNKYLYIYTVSFPICIIKFITDCDIILCSTKALNFLLLSLSCSSGYWFIASCKYRMQIKLFYKDVLKIET